MRRVLDALALRKENDELEIETIDSDFQAKLRFNARYRGWRLSFRNTPQRTYVWRSGSVPAYKEKLAKRRAQ